MERIQMIPVCTVVESLAGRDKGHLYVVVGSLAYPYVWIADGRKYNLDKPKKRIAGISGYWERAYPLEALVPRESAMNGYGPS